MTNKIIIIAIASFLTACASSENSKETSQLSPQVTPQPIVQEGKPFRPYDVKEFRKTPFTVTPVRSKRLFPKKTAPSVTAVNMDPVFILQEIGRQTKVPVISNARSQVNVTLDMKSLPLKEMVNIVCDFGGLYCSFDGSKILVEDQGTYSLSLPPLNNGATAEARDYQSKFYETLRSDLESFGAKEISVNEFARTMTFQAKSRTYADIKSYIDKMRQQRVLITYDVWVAEVALNRSSERGIRWNEFSISSGNDNVSFNGGTTVIDGYSAAISLVGDINLNLVASFLEENGDVKTITNPRLSLVSGTRASFEDQQTDSYIAAVAVNPTSNEGTTPITTGLETQEIDTGLKIEIGGDFDEGVVQTELLVDLSVLLQFRNLGESTDVRIEAPQTARRLITTAVRSMPGEVVIIGGITTNRAETSDSKVPFLGDIVKPAFSSNSGSDQASELVITLIPRIVFFNGAS